MKRERHIHLLGWDNGVCAEIGINYGLGNGEFGLLSLDPQ